MNKLKFPIFLFLIDAVTKLLAVLLLPFNEYVPINDDLSFYLTYNKTPFGAGTFYLGMDNVDAAIYSALLGFLYGSLFLLVNKIIRGDKLRIVIFIALIYGLSYINIQLPSIGFLHSWSPRSIALIKFSGIIWMVFLFFHYTKIKSYAYLWGMLLAAALGNAVNYLIPPYGAVDFISSEYLTRRIGMGIFNFADVLVYLFGILFLLRILLSLFTILKLNIQGICRYAKFRNGKGQRS
ncbi:signal peptidase II [Spirochaeta cellobiosiphila]|uniref:signal peptidase II n=1 Tax=Spirochaeta cellobiosiphila TaxID=504483 RepID=UPI00040C25D6|nr:signal peptidase II [Spirochaeta cellobiosiphila]